jgi:hypothetical protein
VSGASFGAMLMAVHPISAYLTSEQGAALVLDQDVNRSGYVQADLGKALDAFYKAHPEAPKDPAKWTSKQREKYAPSQRVCGRQKNER